MTTIDRILVIALLGWVGCGGGGTTGTGGTPGAGGMTGTGGTTGGTVQNCEGGMSWTAACLTCLKTNCATQFADAYGSSWQLEHIAADGSCGPVWKCNCDCFTTQPECPVGGLPQCPLPTAACKSAMTATSTCATDHCPTECKDMI